MTNITVQDVRGWVLAARINSVNGLNADNRIAEVVYVIGRRIREITGVWPFGECTNVREPYSVDFYLSFGYGDRVDPQYGYGKLAYQYCRRYAGDNEGLWQRLGAPVDSEDDLL